MTAPEFMTWPSMIVCGGSGREAVADDLQLLASLFELHDLDRARADVDADQVFAFGHECSVESVALAVAHGQKRAHARYTHTVPVDRSLRSLRGAQPGPA